jgi:O-antigen/teichoic acid export membrane protein
MITGIGWPFLMFAALMAFPIIQIMFGSQWDAAVPILRLVCFAALIGMSTAHNGELLTAVGKVGVVTLRVTILQIVRISALIVAAMYSVNVVAAAQVPLSVFGFFYIVQALVKHAGLEWQTFFRALGPSFVATITTMIVPIWISFIDTPSADNLWSPLLLAGLAAALVWPVALWATNHPLWLELKEFAIARLGRRAFARRHPVK